MSTVLDHAAASPAVNASAAAASTPVLRIEAVSWQVDELRGHAESALQAVERGHVLHFPQLPFALETGEAALLDPSLADPKRKNISLEADGSALRGVVGAAEVQQRVAALIGRFQHRARELVDTLFADYRGRLRTAPASLRVHPVEYRNTSWRHDDSRLHIDAFPSRPLAGERILRVFLNIHPSDEARVWRVGEPFEAVARRFLGGIAPYRPWLAGTLHRVGVTKQRRTHHDHLMLGLHDAMKADLGYQRDCPQQTLRFAPGSAWVCFSDQTSHAVMSGQHMLEQTFFVPVAAMRTPEQAPLRVLERLVGAPLI